MVVEIIEDAAGAVICGAVLGDAVRFSHRYRSISIPRKSYPFLLI